MAYTLSTSTKYIKCAYEYQWISFDFLFSSGDNVLKTLAKAKNLYKIYLLYF